MTLRDLVRTDVVTAGPDASLASVTETMRDEGVGSVVVVENGVPVGIVTDRDVALRALTSLEDRTASQVMTPDPVVIDVDAGVFEATELLKDAGVRRLPVTGGDLVGILTLDDLVWLLVDELDNLTDVIEAESPPY